MKNIVYKSIVAMLLAVSLLSSFAACSDSGTDKKDVENTTSQTEPSLKNEEPTYDESGLVEADRSDLVEIETMGLTVTAPDSNIEISANTKYFTTSLTRTDFNGKNSSKFRTYEGNENNLTELFVPSSSNLAVARSLPKFFSGSIDDFGKINATQVASDTTSGYVAFDIFVKVDKDQRVYWDETTVTCNDNPDVVSAMRVALVNCGTVAPNAEASAILGVKPANANNNTVVMYEPNSKNHTDASGYADGAIVPDLYITGSFSNRTPTGNGKNIVQEAQYAGPALGTRATDETKASNAYFNAVTGINRVRVYLWIEGNDVDCVNAVAASTIDFNLVFTNA